MSAEIDNKNFVTTVLAAVNSGAVPDFSKYTYGLWISFFENPNHSENGYSIPKPLIEDIVASKFPVTGKKFSTFNFEGEAPKGRIFLTEGLLGLDGYDYLRDFEITDRFISESYPSVVMPDMDYAGKIYRRYEITGLTKSKSTNNNILTVSGEDWAETSISVSSNNTDAAYTYIDNGYSGYENEVTTRYKFLYNDSGNSLVQDSSIFEIPFQLENQSSLKYRVSRASEPLGIYDFADLTADGKAIIDYSKYKDEISGVIDGQIVYNFETVADLSFSKAEFENIYNNNTTDKRRIDDISLTGFEISKSETRFDFKLKATGDFNDIYKVDVSVERFYTKEKPSISGYVMTSYNTGEGLVNITLTSGGNVLPRINEDGLPFGYENLQDLIDIEQISESEKYAQEVEIPDVKTDKDESTLFKSIEDNFSATMKALNGEFGDEIEKTTDLEAWGKREEIDKEDIDLLNKANNQSPIYKTALPNFPLPKKNITKDFYSNYINSGESYIVTPLGNYGQVPTFVSCGDEFGVLTYNISKDKNAPPGSENVFRTVINSTCDGLYIDATGFCKGDSAIYSNKKVAKDGSKIQNGLVTRIPENGTISKINYIDQDSWLNAVNYFYNKNYVASFNVYPTLPQSGYNTLFSQALREANQRIGGPSENNTDNSFYSNGARSPRIFVEREIYAKSYKENQSLEVNQAIISGVYIPSDADLTNEESEKLYCVQTYEPNDSNSFAIDKQDYFYPVQDYNEEISFRNFLDNSGAGLLYSTGENFGRVVFTDTDADPYKLYRAEYVTGNSFSYTNTLNFAQWSGDASPPSNILINNQNTKNYSYHLYGYNSATGSLSLVSSNVQNQQTVSAPSFNKLVVLKFIKQGITDLVSEIEIEDNNKKTTKSYIDTTIAYSDGSLVDSSKVFVNIQTYNYKLKVNSEAHQWIVFNQNPINNNIYGNRKNSNLSEPRFFQDDEEETKDALSTLFFFPNGPYTSKNYEGKPVYTSSINALSDGLFENMISIKEQNEDFKSYESNYVLEVADNGTIIKQKPPAFVSATKFRDTRRLQITKVKYNFYTKDLILIGDAGFPSATSFNDGWEYDLQYKIKSYQSGSSGTSGSSGSSGSGAAIDWTIMSKEGNLSKDIISSQYSVISPYYYSAADLVYPNSLPMVAFKTNLPLFLDDANYEFRILKRERLIVLSDSANVIKKTNFLPIEVDWNESPGCEYYNIYQKDRNNNLIFLKSEPSGVNSLSYVVPDVKQKNVDLGVYNFGANGINYYDIVVSGIKSAVTEVEQTLSGEYGFEIGDSNSSQNKVTKLSQVASYVPVNISSPTYSQLLDFNNPESKTSAFKIDQNYNNYYFVTDKADATLSNIPTPFESYVLNTGNASCLVGASTLSSNYYAKISDGGAITSFALSSLPSSTLDLSSTENDDFIYSSSDLTILNAGLTPVTSRTLILINDSIAPINVTFGSVETVAANQTKKLLFTDAPPQSITLLETYSNITAQDSQILHPKDGFINLDYVTGAFSSADTFSDLPVYNFSKENLVINNLTLLPDSFNYVSWDGLIASKSQKSHFDYLKIYLNGNESSEDLVKLIKDDIEIIISQFSLSIGASQEYFFLKDESINRSLNIKIVNGSSVENLSYEKQDFKLKVTRNKDGAIIYSITYPSNSPFFNLSDSKEQFVLFKGDSETYVNLKSLAEVLPKESFVYYVNKSRNTVYFYKQNPEDSTPLEQNQVARAMIVTLGGTNTIRFEILNDTLSHFNFEVTESLMPSAINILNLNFCCTNISLPPASSLTSKDLFIICRNRFIPNKIDKQKIKDKDGIISTTNDSSTLEINEIGDIAENSISLRVYRDGDDLLPTVERTSFLERKASTSLIDTKDNTISESAFDAFYVRNKNIDTFTIKDFYNRKTDYKGKIFLPTSNQELTIQSFDSVDNNNSFNIKRSNSVDFDYYPDDYANGRLQVSSSEESDAKIYSYESEAGSVAKSFPNALASDQILINFAYDTVTVSVVSSTVTLKKNRLVKNYGSNYVYPVYNKKEFFIALNNSDRNNTVVNGGSVFYYVIEADKIDVDYIILPDTSATVSFVIKNDSGRPYQIKTLSGTSVYALLPNDKKLFTYTGSTYAVTDDTTDFDDRSIINAPTAIALSNQYLELDSEHPLASLWNYNASDFKISTIDNAFIGSGNDTTILIKDAAGISVSYGIFDVYTSVPSATDNIVYCYGRKSINLNTLGDKKYIVNDFYLFIYYGNEIISREQFYVSPNTSDLISSGVNDLKIIDTSHTDLTKFFDKQNTIAALPNVIFIPITNYNSKFYLPNLKHKIINNAGNLVQISTLLVGKKIIFVNLTKSDSTGASSVYKFNGAETTELLDINSLALYSVSGDSWVKESSSLPVVKEVFATVKNLKGISDLSTTEIVGGKEFLYLPNFNRFNVDLNSFEDKSFRDFYVFNPCKYRLYIGSNNSLLGTGAFVKISRDPISPSFLSKNLDLNSSSAFSLQTFSYPANQIPNDMAAIINKDFPNLKPATKIKVIQKVEGIGKTYFFNYDSNRIAHEVIIKNKDYGVLDLDDLLNYSSTSKLFVYGSSRVDDSGGSFDTYNLKLLNAGKLLNEKFYVYNNTQFTLQIFFDNKENSLAVPSNVLVEISSSGLRFLGFYKKNSFYISKKLSNVNYLIKTDLDININGLLDYENFEGIKESENQIKNILITNIVRDEQFIRYSYYNLDGKLLEIAYDNFKALSFIKLSDLSTLPASDSSELKNVIKKIYSISSPGHYLLNDNSNDVIVAEPAPGQQIFLINNCPRDIFVTVSGLMDARGKIYRNSVLVVENGPTVRYLKKSKSRDEFYCVFNPNTSISTQRELTLELGIIKNEDLFPIMDNDGTEQKSYVKLLAKDGSSSKINLTLRNYYNGKDIPTDSPANVVGYEIGIGHETIYRFLFFNPEESTYTLPGIQKGVKYQVGINKGFFDSINISTDASFTNIEEVPFLKYKGKKFLMDGDTFVGEDVSVYEVKYPNFVTLYKVVEDIDRQFLDIEDKGEEGGIDPSITEQENVTANALDLFKSVILDQYRPLSKSLVSWIPEGQSAFWLASNYSDDWWVLDVVDPNQTLTISVEGTNNTITFTKCEIKKTGLKTTLFKYDYSYYSALKYVRQMPNNQDLLIGLDSALGDEQELPNMKKWLNEQQFEKDTLLPSKEMKIGGLYIKDLLDINAENPSITSSVIKNSDFSVNVAVSKIKNMPDISFEDFSKSSIIKIINKK